MFFRFEIGARARSVSRLVGGVRRDVLKAILQEKAASGLTQQQLAEKLGVSRSTLGRSLSGRKELTLRSIAELAWALNREVSLEFREPDVSPLQNYFSETSTAIGGGTKRLGSRATSGFTSRGYSRAIFAKPAVAEEE